MGVYQKIRDARKNPTKELEELWRSRLFTWRREEATVRIERPTRLDRARSLGYKAKQGIILVRQRVMRGGHYRAQIDSGRRPRNFGRNKNLQMSYQWIAEQRAAKKHLNCEVLNSYWVAEDGRYYWYEVILVDRDHPVIKKDKNLKWIADTHGRVFHGTTSAGKKCRGLRVKGKGAEKLRPSRTAKGY